MLQSNWISQSLLSLKLIKYATDLEIVTKKLQEREIELIDLQKKVIELYEELRNVKSFV